MAMTETTAILAIVGGCAVIIFAFVIKQFYAARSLLGVSLSGRQIQTWKGRLLFVGVGAFLILIGVTFFLFDQ